MARDDALSINQLVGKAIFHDFNVFNRLNNSKNYTKLSPSGGIVSAASA